MPEQISRDANVGIVSGRNSAAEGGDGGKLVSLHSERLGGKLPVDCAQNTLETSPNGSLPPSVPECRDASLPPSLSPITAQPFARWWIYQRERFPIFTHGPLIAAFSFCMVSYSSLVRGYVRIPDAKALLVAFVTAFIFFLQMRIADEFKDYAEDARYRSYRPVPRGLISLRELGSVGIIGGAIQLGLALWLSTALLPFLLGVWLYLGLMTREFFIGPWLRKHPIVYMWSHMLIIPLIDLYGTACDWHVAGVAAPNGLIFLICVSFFNGFVLEIGRKLRVPQDEETGVETYSFLWGRRRATLVWGGALAVTALSVCLAASKTGFARPEVVLFSALLLMAAGIATRFLLRPVTGRGKWIELFSGLWTLLVYLSLGVLPLIWQLVAKGG
jgi:hypothetical protein